MHRSRGGGSYIQVHLNDERVEEKIQLDSPVNFVVHGWTQSFRGGFNHRYSRDINGFDNNWVHDLSSDWAKFAGENVCAVDWSRLAMFDYSVAVKKNSRVVAKRMHEFALFLAKLGIDIELISVVGHSLGSHIAGFFGALFQGLIKAIYSKSFLLLHITTTNKYVTPKNVGESCY